MPTTTTPPTLKGGLLFGSGPEALRDSLGLYTRAQRELGDVVRFRGVPGLHWYLVSHPSAAEHVLKTRGRIYRKPDRFTVPVRMLAGNGILASEGESWLQNRRLMQPAFHRQRLAGLAAQMTDAAEATSRRWSTLAADGAEVDAADEMLRYTLRVVGTTLFSYDLSGNANQLGEAVRDAMAHVSGRITLPFSLPLWIRTRENRRFIAARDRVWATVDEVIRVRRDSGEERADLLSMLLAARDADTGARMDDRQIRDEVLTLMLAGHETTAAALTWTWYLLATHPDVAERLRDEVDAVLAGRPATAADLPQLPYTRAVFDETLRLYPPAWGQPREAVEEDEIGGYHIPRGALVIVGQYVTQRRPDLWERPDEFVPGRFVGAGPASFPPFAYYPFGGGARQCIGSAFALMEAQVVIATLAQRFRVELVPGHAVVPDATFVLRPKHGVKIRIHPRTPAPAFSEPAAG